MKLDTTTLLLGAGGVALVAVLMSKKKPAATKSDGGGGLDGGGLQPIPGFPMPGVPKARSLCSSSSWTSAQVSKVVDMLNANLSSMPIPATVSEKNAAAFDATKMTILQLCPGLKVPASLAQVEGYRRTWIAPTRKAWDQIFEWAVQYMFDPPGP